MYMLKIDKESLNEKLLRSEEKLNDSEMNTNSLKQQILNMQCNLKSKEEDLIMADKQLEDYRMKTKSANDELTRLEEKLKSNAIDLASYQSIKDDLENKV